MAMDQESASVLTSPPGRSVDSGEDSGVQRSLEKPQEDRSSSGVDSGHCVQQSDTSSDVCHPKPPLKRVSRQEKRRKEGEERKWKAPPLSMDSVMAVLEGVADKWRDVGNRLYIPAAALSVIDSDFTTDLDRLRAAVRYWLLRDPYASWRRLIWQLDYSGGGDLKRVADGIRNYAEKLSSDADLASSKVLAALKSVEDVEDVEYLLQVPGTKRSELKPQSGSEEERRERAVRYFLQTSPYASWKWLAGRLLYCRETEALQQVKEYIKSSNDPTLTITNLAQLLFSVEEWTLFYLYYLDIPSAKHTTIKRLNSGLGQHKKVYCEWYLNNHPAPSWKHVADGLYLCGDHCTLDVLWSQYLKGSKESRRLLSEAMKDGHVDSLINKIVLYGAPGTGKSSFMDLIVGNPPSDIHSSTPLAARPVSVFQIDMTHEEWKTFSLQERRAVLVQAMMSIEIGQGEEDTSSDAVSISGDKEQAGNKPIPVNTEAINAERMSSTQDPDPSLSAASPPTTSPSVQRCDPSRPSKLSLLRSISSMDEMVELIDEYAKTGEAITSHHKILFIDSGGQPQFHEMLPVFLRRMSLYMFVFKLSEELATKPVVEYYDSRGEIVGRPYQSAQTNEQLLQHCLRTLRTHRASSESKDKPSRIMIVGTHRDKEGECTTETRADKNVKLASLLLPSFKDKVTYSNLANKEFIFAVNAKNPQPRDKDLAKDIQHLILTECCPTPVRVPLRYYFLEIILEEASETLGRGVLSIDECLAAAAELHFDKHTLDAALQFLDEISVLFYFPEVVEGVVFTNPQVLLDKATEPVEKIYSLRKATSNSEVVCGEWQEFKEHALFTLEFLDHKAFQKHYVYEAGLFTPIELVKLFRRLLIIADFSATHYFMPALLEVLEEDKVCEHRVPRDSPAAALALDFPLGGPRLGTFCSLTCFLVSLNNQYPCPWKIVLLPHSNTPACLYRNCIQFTIPGYPGTIDLIDTFTHFEVHVRTISEGYGDVCPLVRQAIFAGLKKATYTLGYNNCTPSPAVLCPCGDGSTHVATLGKGSWICTKDERKYGTLAARHLVWQEDNTSKPKGSTPTLSRLICFPMAEGKVNLAKKIGSDYMTFGVLLLEDDGEQISAIENELKCNAEKINLRVLQLWVQGKGKQPVTWATLVAVLQDIGLLKLASDIETVKLS